MSYALLAMVVALLGAAIAVQVWYLNGLRRSGVELSGSIKAIAGVNIGLLGALALGLLGYIVYGLVTAGM